MELEEGDAESLTVANGDFSAIATRHADSPDVLLYRGITESRSLSYDKAIADFDRVLKRQPKSAVAAVFQSVFFWAQPLMDLIDEATRTAGTLLAEQAPGSGRRAPSE